MKYFLLFLILFPSLSYAASDDMAEEGKYEAMAQKAIDDCWAISQADRDSGNTQRMRAGNLDTALCMEEHIVHLSEKYFSPDRLN